VLRPRPKPRLWDPEPFSLLSFYAFFPQFRLVVQLTSVSTAPLLFDSEIMLACHVFPKSSSLPLLVGECRPSVIKIPFELVFFLRRLVVSPFFSLFLLAVSRAPSRRAWPLSTSLYTFSPVRVTNNFRSSRQVQLIRLLLLPFCDGRSPRSPLSSLISVPIREKRF